MVLNILLTLLFWVPGAIHACLLVSKHYSDKRHNELMKVMTVSEDVRQGMSPTNALKHHEDLMRTINSSGPARIWVVGIAAAVIAFLVWIGTRPAHSPADTRATASTPIKPTSAAVTASGTKGTIRRVPPPRTGDKYQRITLDGTVYVNAEIRSVDQDGIEILHSGGVGHIGTAKLPLEWRTFCEGLTAAGD
jgi:hypothetical protein